MMRPTEIFPYMASVLGAITLGVLSCPASAQVSLAQQATTAAMSTPARHSSVQYAEGQLTVTASNASLNGILREIAHATGMKITGAVPEDRVFGSYGPGDPQQVLATLLDGTGTNILILSNEADKPLELVLTRRSGGVSPPSSAETADASADSGDDDAPNPTPATPIQSPIPRTVSQRGPQGRNLPAASSQPSEVTQPVVFAPIGATTAPATATTTPVDPDDASDPGTESVKTPQQIFEQLQKLQQGNGAQDTSQ